MGEIKAGRLRRALLNTLTLFAALAILLAVIEAAIRLFSPQPVNMRGTRFSSTLVYENVPYASFRYKTSEFDSVVAYNNAGFRDNDFTVEKKGLRVAVLGDSYGEGLQVPFDGMFNNQLERMLQKRYAGAEVMNFGVSGYGTDQELVMLKSKVLQYRPDLVILLFVHNDIQDVMAQSLVGVQDGWLVYRVHNPNPAWKGLKTFVRNLHTYYFLSRRVAQLPAIRRSLDGAKVAAFDLMGEEFTRAHFPQISREVKNLRDKAGVSVELGAFYEPVPEEVRRLWELEFRMLAEMKKASEENGAGFAIVITTKDIQLDRRAYEQTVRHYRLDESRFVIDNPNREILRFGRENGVPVLDLYPVFRRLSDAGEVFHFKKDGHWNQHGHDVAAKEIFSFLVDKGLLGPAPAH